jgi:hypothetical protein
MARTSKSRGKSGFKMRSTNKTSFKDMGSSPVKYTNPATGDDLNPYAPDVIQTMGAMGMSGDVIEQIIKDKTKKEEEKVDAGQKINTKDQIDTNVSKVEDIKKVKPKKTKFQEKWEKKHGTGDYKRGGSKERERMQTGESKFQADVRRRRETNKAKRSMVDEDKDGMSDFIQAPQKAPKGKETVSSKPKSKPESKGDYHTFSGKKGDKYKYRAAELLDAQGNRKTQQLQQAYQFQRPGSDIWETSKTEEGARAIRDLFVEDYEGKNIEITPIQKKSPYKKGIGKYAKKAKGSRGYKMKRK